MPYINGRYVTQDQFNKLKKKAPHIYDGYSSTSGGFVSDLFTLNTLMDSISSDSGSFSFDSGSSLSSDSFSSGGGDFGGGGSSGDW